MYQKRLESKRILGLHGDYIWRIFLDMELPSERLSKILRRLTPRQEKVVRLRFGLGCKRSHSVAEIAAEFSVSSARITGILEAASQRLAKNGITLTDLKEAAPEPTVAVRHRHRSPE